MSRYKSERKVKILVVGQQADNKPGAGKSSLLKRYIHQTFDNNEEAGIVNFKIKKIATKDFKRKALIWDLTGQEKFKKITQAYYQGSDAFILVVDITDPNALNNVSHQITDIKNINEDVPIMIAFNKCDEQKQITPEQIEEFKIQNPSLHIHYVSAKNNEGVDELFNSAIEKGYTQVLKLENKKPYNLNIQRLKTNIDNLNSMIGKENISEEFLSILQKMSTAFTAVHEEAENGGDSQQIKNSFSYDGNLETDIQQLQSISNSTTRKNIMETIKTCLLCLSIIGIPSALSKLNTNQKERGNRFLFYTDSPKQAAEAAHNISQDLMKPKGGR
ncbi:MAG: Rab family GTPase [Legionellaceae bacterium]|nr:Rab family GTPase [Legionellaceae bacterium]